VSSRRSLTRYPSNLCRTLKAFHDETYREYVGARLEPVLDSLRKMKQLGVRLAVTTLVIPGVNDGPAELRDAARFIPQELGPETPWHVSRFFPAYQMSDVPPAPFATLQQAQEMGREEGLRYIYIGNVPGDGNTFCHHCGRLLIRRSDYQILEGHIRPDGHCRYCGTSVAGVGMGG